MNKRMRKIRENIAYVVLLPVVIITMILIYGATYILVSPLFLLFNIFKFFIYLDFKHFWGIKKLFTHIVESWEMS